MSDIVERLHGPDGIKAADEILRLRADLKTLNIAYDKLYEDNVKLRAALNEIATAKPAAAGLELRAKWLQKAAAAALKETGDE